MKKTVYYRLVFSGLLVLFASVASAQSTFNKIWESRFDNNPDNLLYGSQDGLYAVGTTEKSICVLDGKTGTKLWGGRFIDLYGARQAESQHVMMETNSFLLINKKAGLDEMICADIKTGQKKWSNASFANVKLDHLIYIPEINALGVTIKGGMVMLDVNTGQEKWQLNFRNSIPKWMYMPDKQQLVFYNFELNSLKRIAKGLENQMLCVDAKNGKVIWDKTMKGFVGRKNASSPYFSQYNWTHYGLTARSVGDKNILLDFYRKNDRLFLILDGTFSVIDLNNGNKLWEAPYHLSYRRGATNVFDAIARPLITEEFVYIVDIHAYNRKKTIKKYHLESGQLVWETPAIKGSSVIIPNLYLVDGVLVAQMGGYANVYSEKAIFSPTTSPLGGITSNSLTGISSNSLSGIKSNSSKWKWLGPFGLKGIDPETGQVKWETAKYKKQISNPTVVNGNLFVADAAKVYQIDPKTGANLAELLLKPAKIGGALQTFENSGKLYIVGDKGLAAFDPAGKNQVFAIKTKETSLSASDMIGSTFFLADEKSIKGIDLSSGTQKGEYKYKKDSDYIITEDGKTIFVVGKKQAGRYQIN